MTYGVVTVTRNANATIGRTIESVLTQTVTPARWMFVDGGSTDGTLDTIERACAAAKNAAIEARLVHQQGRGITNAWNIGVGELDTDIVFILNADDWYEPDAGAHVMTAFERHREAEIVLAAGRYVDPSGNKPPEICRPRPSWVLPAAMSAIHPACFVRRSVYDRIGLFDERYAIVADYEFIFRCVSAGVEIETLDAVVVNVLEGGIATQQRSVARTEMAEIGERYSRAPLVPKLALQMRRWLDR